MTEPTTLDRIHALAAELHRRLGRLEELRTDPDHRDTVFEHVRGETIGLRAALGILLGAPAKSGGKDVAVGEAYYQHWLNQQAVKAEREADRG